MKLALKIIGIIFMVTTFLLIIDTTYSAHREIQLFDQDMQRDARLIGDALRSLITNVWQNSGEFEAIQVIHNLNERQANIGIRWVWLEDLKQETSLPPSSQHQLFSTLERHETAFLEVKQQDGQYLHTFVPVQIEDLNLAAIELSESLAQRDEYVNTTIFRAGVLIVSLLVLNGLLLWFLGIKLVGQPLQRLVEKTHRISKGDLAPDVHLKGHDELTKLGDALNEMCNNLGAARDKARHETEKRIATMEQLRHSERLATVGRLASGVAHELGTPLNVVSGRAKLIANQSLTEEENKEFATIIHQQAERMTKIIRQLLDFSRRRAPQRSSVQIPMIFDQVKDLLKPIAQKKNVEIQIGASSQLPPIEVDYGQIQQVLINLVMNAIQAMPDGGVVKLDAQLEKNSQKSKSKTVQISITDQGEGISPEHLDHIFEPFFTTKDVGVGTGLGLSIVYGIIEEHGGHITVNSKVGQGTTFMIILPTGSTA